MSTKKQDHDANQPAGLVRDIAEPVKTVPNDVSVRVALNELNERNSNSSLVTNQRGELLGTVSKNELNRKVGGLGHDPATEAVEPQIAPSKAECFDDQTVAEAKDVMLHAQVAEIAVVTHEKLLVGTTSLEAIAREKESDIAEKNPPDQK